ncbi:uncharacterized protein LOC135143904 [Zophobas morio]|uniref:uncharacterized protein LOC135143904 n=1 Tax=Zophobas morio TaxID=2755281 RepID=UPI00308398DB
MGGGMASGKSSIAGKVTETDWWEKHNNCVVFINADRIKAVDPVFQALKEEVSEYASELVHSYSVKASEELFLTALKKRRHIIFDGTLSWAPYVSQTIEMLRDNKHIYKRGPGYLLNSNKNGTNFLKEKYWDIESACEKPLRPYCIDLIGVTSSVSIALTRGLVRRFVTGRGVPIEDQVTSHRLFSEAFPRYFHLFDVISLYDNNRSDLLLTDTPVGPELIFERKNNEIVYINIKKYKKFLKIKNICTRDFTAAVPANEVEELKKQTFLLSSTRTLNLLRTLNSLDVAIAEFKGALTYNTATRTSKVNISDDNGNGRVSS